MSTTLAPSLSGPTTATTPPIVAATAAPAIDSVSSSSNTQFTSSTPPQSHFVAASQSALSASPQSSFTATRQSTSSTPPQSQFVAASQSALSASPQSSFTATRQSTSSAPPRSTLPAPPRSTFPAPPPNHTLADGAVAGIAIAAAVGGAVLAALVTFLILRRKRNLRDRHRQRGSDEKDGPPLGLSDRRSPQSDPEKNPISIGPSSNNTFEDHLPQPADDRTVQSNVQTVLDQIELHVENFYQNSSGSISRLVDADFAPFESSSLRDSLAKLLPQSQNPVLLIKHALAQFVTSSISLRGSPETSLLPRDFVLVPMSARSARTGGSIKPDFGRAMFRWRLLTAYLRANPSQDPDYIAERDQKIGVATQTFSRAFRPWWNAKYSEEQRARSLSTILQSAADLGIWMFSQAFELQFEWPKQEATKLVVLPALLKTTDERGRDLTKPQVILRAVVR